MSSTLLSIVIPTFNRLSLLPAAIDSALAWLDTLGRGEVIVIDDGSTDGTAAMVRDRYAGPLARGAMIFRRRECNGGPTAAKNTGGLLARGDWIVFLDSDDELIPAAAPEVVAELAASGAAPAVFFRCLDHRNGTLLGAEPLMASRLGLVDQVSDWRWGECLPVVRADAFRRFPFEAALRGYEGLAYARMLRAFGPAIVSLIVARIYRTEGEDRVSAIGRLARSGAHKCYASIMLSEFAEALTWRSWGRMLLSYLRASVETRIAGA